MLYNRPTEPSEHASEMSGMSLQCIPLRRMPEEDTLMFIILYSDHTLTRNAANRRIFSSSKCTTRQISGYSSGCEARHIRGKYVQIKNTLNMSKKIRRIKTLINTTIQPIKLNVYSEK